MSLETICPDRYARSVVTTFRGTVDEVLDAVKSEIICYHPHGYGTWVERVHMLSDGRLEAIVKRSGSCD